MRVFWYRLKRIIPFLTKIRKIIFDTFETLHKQLEKQISICYAQKLEKQISLSKKDCKMTDIDSRKGQHPTG